MEEVGLRKFPSEKELESIKKEYLDLDEFSVLIILKYLSISKEIIKSYNRFFKKYDLTDAKFSVLMVLFRTQSGTLFPYEIANQLGITRASVTTLLDGLNRKNLVKRQHDVEDRRKIVIALTEIGRRCLTEILPVHYQLTQSITSNFSFKQKQDFLKYLSKLEIGLKEYKLSISQLKKEEKNE